MSYTSFVALLLLCIMLGWLHRRQRIASAILVPGRQLLGRAARTWRTRLVWLPFWTRLVALILLALVVSGLKTTALLRQPRTGISIQLVVDCSQSMDARDFDRLASASRLDGVRSVLLKMLESGSAIRPDDKIGLITFANSPQIKCPLSSDHQLTAGFIDVISSVAPTEEGTNIGDAVGLALAALKEESREPGIILLLTDGENEPLLQPDRPPLAPLDAALIAKKLGVRIYAISLAAGDDPEGGEALLRQLAGVTEGGFFAAGNRASLEEAFAQVEAIQRNLYAEAPSRSGSARVLLLSVLALLVGEILLREWWLRLSP